MKKNMMKVLAAVLVLMTMLTGAASAEKTMKLGAKNGTKIEKRNDDFNGSVKIKMVTEKKALEAGETVTLKAIVKGGKKVNYTLRWEIGNANGEWKEIDETMAEALNISFKKKTMSFPLTAATAGMSFRVAVVTK